MSEQHFQPGDVVQLKSGGPKMTVERSGKVGNSTAGRTSTIWWNSNEYIRESFDTRTLKTYQESRIG